MKIGPVTYSDSASGESAQELAAAMHEESVHLWNRFWWEAGENLMFDQRAKVELIQKTLNELAWPSG